MCEQNEAGVLSTVSPPVGAEWGLSKNSPLPHSKFGADPPFKKILFCGDPHLLQVLKISFKNFCPFLTIFFNLQKNVIFLELGEFPIREKSVSMHDTMLVRQRSWRSI